MVATFWLHLPVFDTFFHIFGMGLQPFISAFTPWSFIIAMAITIFNRQIIYRWAIYTIAMLNDRRVHIFFAAPSLKSRQDFQSPHAAAAAEVALHGLSPEDRRYACANACACAFIKQNQTQPGLATALTAPNCQRRPVLSVFFYFLGEWIMNGMSELGSFLAIFR